MDDFEQTQKLLRLKRYETPPDEYFDGFLKEFHQRQRVELLKRSSRSLFFERLGTYISGFGSSRLMFAGGAAAAIALAVLVTSRPNADPTQTVNSAAVASTQEFDGPRGEIEPVSSESPAAITSSVKGDDTTEQFRRLQRPAAAETQTFEL